MKGNPASWMVGPVLFLTGLAVFLGPRQAPIPLSEATTIAASQIDPSPLREVIHDPPHLIVASYEKGCMDCHALFKSRTTTQFAMFQHEEIRRDLDHGINTRCYNCHDLEARDKLVLHDGSTIGYDQVEHLCAKCHGPTFRDWQRGSHGKTLGFWDRLKGTPEKLKCTQCHDPHAPAFSKFHLLPGPNTLRMTPPSTTPLGEIRTHDEAGPIGDDPIREGGTGEGGDYAGSVDAGSADAGSAEEMPRQGPEAEQEHGKNINPLRRWNKSHSTAAPVVAEQADSIKESGSTKESGQDLSLESDSKLPEAKTNSKTSAKLQVKEKDHE